MATQEQETVPSTNCFTHVLSLFHFNSTAKPQKETKSAETNKKLPFDGKKIVFVLGGPGSGKGTQCDRIVEKYKYHHISVGDLLRHAVEEGSELSEEITAIMKEGKMVPMYVTKKLLLNAMEKAGDDVPGFLIDGFPRQMDQAEEFERDIGHCTFVLFFDCPHDVLVGRLLKRGETSGRADDNEETIKKRIATFVEASLPVVEHYAKDNRVRKVNGDASIEDVTAATLKVFE
ncbi:ADK-domain-containing protein [Basidiobolus meristosporus CBS 931.73]|uniref:adenylate kinase n=1 Tax=Basidiobolus meristosporus CBS 931.73 TaxID=1314790 RepID=A0A1Y1YS09_9FUNG|nr:ADK-domain-containing protein [Basidiobolus meristosporus CBS 931.73]|eukprot:ORY00823.1 ADK-domain-containing protein [Basidiobolus meristosporus CBS 931.73]